MAALAVGLSSCVVEVSGDATAADDSQAAPATSAQDDTEDDTEDDGDGTSGSPSESSESSAESPGDSPASALDPCELLTPAERAELSLGPGVEESLAGARSCLWQASGSHSVGIDIWPDLVIEEVESETEPEPLTVGSRRAVRYTGALEVCGIALELTGSSRVDVVGVAGGDLPRACAVAMQAAELVEAKLP